MWTSDLEEMLFFANTTSTNTLSVDLNLLPRFGDNVLAATNDKYV